MKSFRSIQDMAFTLRSMTRILISAVRTCPTPIFALLLLASGLGVEVSKAQAPDVYMGSERKPIRITTGAVYQQYSDQDSRLSQVGFPITAFIPVNRSLGFTLRANPALVSGDAVTALEGMSDAQAAVSFYQPIGEGSVVLSVSSNLPSGKRELTEEEFATTALLSQDFYGFYVPVFGQGLNISPGITFAYPLGENVAGGIGASYQLKGGFKPVQNMPEAFTPGAELLMTGGLDFKLNPSWALSTNFTYMLYQPDKLGEETVYESGNQFFTSAQLLGNLGINQVRVIGSFRTKAKSQLPVGGDFVTAPRSVPQQFRLLGMYSLRLQENMRANLLVQLRHFNESDFFSNKTLFDLGASQEYAFSEVVATVLRFKYTFGSFPGVELGLGLSFTIP